MTQCTYLTRNRQVTHINRCALYMYYVYSYRKYPLRLLPTCYGMCCHISIAGVLPLKKPKQKKNGFNSVEKTSSKSPKANV